MEHITDIEKIVAGGRGLARPAGGKVIMTDFVLPGETVRIREAREFSGYIEGKLLEILSPSPQRIRPACVHYGECGGCDLQHTHYHNQLELKKAIVSETMVRAGIPLAGQVLQAPVPSPCQWGYRCRVRLKIDRRGRIGFFKKKSNSFVAISTCPVTTQPINAALVELQTTGVLSALPESCSEIELLQSPLDQKITLVILSPKQKMPAAAVIQAISGCTSLDVIGCKTKTGFYQLVPAPRPAPLSQSVPLLDHRQSCTLAWSAGCFSQVNAGQNAQLVQLVCRLAGKIEGRSVLDLYCGMGNFSLPLALLGAAVTGIELNPESISWARHNAEAAAVYCSFTAADVLNSLRQLVQNREQVDTIIIDPPRRGIGKAAALLHHLLPEQILYNSCDPATLARDLAIICKQGYSLRQLVPVDMFPQTHHIESVALLKKN